MRVLPWSNTFLLAYWAELGSIKLLLVNQPVVLLIERSEKMEEGIAAWAQFRATERSPSMYIRMRVLPWVTLFLLVSVGRINYQLFWWNGRSFACLIERSGNVEGKSGTATLGHSFVRRKYNVRMRVLPWVTRPAWGAGSDQHQTAFSQSFY
jgi:hypothetical protein